MRVIVIALAIGLAAVVMPAALAPAPARALPGIIPICGDANNDGDITISDGIHALRAAVGLPDICTIAICDVDADGEITVNDSVNIIRNALILPAIDRCRDVTATPVPTPVP